MINNKNEIGYGSASLMMCKGVINGYDEEAEIIGYFKGQHNPLNMEEFTCHIVPPQGEMYFEVDSARIFPATRHYDKNRNPIFEYDILNLGSLQEVCGAKMAFVQWCDYKGQYALRCSVEYSSKKYILADYWKDTKVIGNIFTTPKVAETFFKESEKYNNTPSAISGSDPECRSYASLSKGIKMWLPK